jgi:hypothetical protein
MNSKRAITMIVSAGLFVGCQRSGETTTIPATAPAAPIAQSPPVQPVAEIPATAPATQPELATLLIDSQGYSFPRAVLRLSVLHGRVVARLSTDDPAAAIEQGYSGNSFDLNMPLNIDDPDKIDSAHWRFTASAPPQRESDRGIFLDGQRQRLHPQDVGARFQRDGDRITVMLSGFFLLYQNTPSERSFVPPRRVYVQGRLEAIVPVQ